MRMDVALTNNQSPRTSSWRWLALFFQAFFAFGLYYSDDNLQALKTRLVAPPIDLSNFQFNLLYSVYQFPNMILPLFGGFFIDYFGIRFSLGVFSFVLIAGHALFTLGVYQASFTVMIFGRFLFAITGENVSVAQSAIISKWFKQKELAFAFGISLVACILGGMVNNVVTPRIASSTDSAWFPCFLGVITLILSFLLALGAVWMDYKADKFEGTLKSQQQPQKEDEDDPSTKIRLSDLTNFNGLFWMLLINSVLIYAVFSSFLTNANDFLGKRFNVDEVEAGNMVFLIYTVSMFASPFIGLIIDRFGRRTFWLNLSAVLVFAGLLTFLLIPSHKETIESLVILPLIIFGVGFAIYTATMWACVPLVVEERTLGTSYGVATASQSGVGALALLLAGLIEDWTKSEESGYFWTVIFLLVLTILGLASGLILASLNRKKSGNLDVPLITKDKVDDEEMNTTNSEESLTNDDSTTKSKKAKAVEMTTRSRRLTLH